MNSPKQPQAIDSPGRRNWLKVLLGLTFTTLFLQIGRAMGSFLLPPDKENEFGGKILVGPLAELPNAEAEPKLYPAGKFWLVNNDQQLTALHSSCTHLNCLFTWDTNKQVFICPCHGSEFSRHGEVLKGPAARNLDSFPLEIIDAKERVIVSGNQSLTLDTLPVAKEEEEPINLRLYVDTGQKIRGKANTAL